VNFKAQLEDLSQMLMFICSEAKHFPLSKEALGKLELASEEALVNIISHGKPGAELTIGCGKNRGRFEVIIKDKGPAFNPLESEINPMLDRPIAERHIGGLGIYLMRTLLDEMVYQRVGEENILRLIVDIDHSRA